MIIAVIILSISSCVTIVVFNAPDSAQAGEIIPISLKLKRDQGSYGTTGSSNYTLFFYLSTDRYYNSEDIELLNHQGDGLNINGDLNVSLDLQIPTNLLSGEYYLIAISDDGHSSIPDIYAFEEAEAANVVYKRITINGTQSSLSDLVIDNTYFYSQLGYNVGNYYTRTSILPGGTINMNASIKNLGGSASGACQGSLYFSTNSTLSSGDILIQNFDIPSIQSQEREELILSVTLPNDNELYIPGYTSYLIFKIDAQGIVPEYSETNNIITKAISTPSRNAIPISADLPIIVHAGSPFNSEVRVLNNAFVTDNAYLQGYLSEDENFSNQDIFLFSTSIPDIGVNAGSMVFDYTGPITIPDDIETGEYYLIFRTSQGIYDQNSLAIRLLVLNYNNFTDPCDVADQYLIQEEKELLFNKNSSQQEEKKFEKPELLVYPNPASDYINLSLENKKEVNNVDLELFSADGKLLHYFSIDHLSAGKFEQQIPIQKLEPGTYFISILLDGEIFQEQFIKQSGR